MQKSILIYDDDEDILTVCQIILSNEGYHVDTRHRTANMLADVSELNPGIILMDMWIPEIGGEMAIQMLKQNQKTRDMPVILFSANAEIQEIAERVKANGFLKKPFEIGMMLKVIEFYII